MRACSRVGALAKFVPPQQCSNRCKTSRQSGKRIDKPELIRKKLQRWISILLLSDLWIEKIAEDRKSNRSHVNSELVLPAALRLQLEQPGAAPQVEQVNSGDRVDRSVRESLAIPRFTRLHSVLHGPALSVRGIADMRGREVLSLDHPFGEEPVVKSPRCRLDREQHNSSGFPVQPMHR